MAAVNSIALIAYAVAAFFLGWYFRGDHERTKAEEAKRHGRNNG
jgi:hypothetical protein